MGLKNKRGFHEILLRSIHVLIQEFFIIVQTGAGGGSEYSGS